MTARSRLEHSVAVFFLAGFLLAACTGLNNEGQIATQNTDPSARLQQATANVGKDFWITGQIRICKEPMREQNSNPCDIQKSDRYVQHRGSIHSVFRNNCFG
jgi:outer membrane biogenesis lipoprotein LolB